MKADKRTPSTLSRALRYVGRYKYLMLLSALLAIATVALTLYFPILVGDAIDSIKGKDTDLGAIAEILFKAAIIIGATALAQWIMSVINNAVAYNVVNDTRKDAFAKLERLPLSYLDRHPVGDVVNRIINDADHFTEGLLLGFTQLLTGILTIAGTLVFMIYLNWVVAIVVFVLTPMSLFIARFIANKTYSKFKLRSQTEGEQTAFIDEMLGNQKVVKAFTREDEAIEKFDEINGRLEKHALSAIFFSSLTNPATRFVNSVVYAAVALVGALIAINAPEGAVVATITVGELSCLLSYANQYTKPFNEISGVMTEFQNALACAGRIFELIDEEAEIPDSEGVTALTEVKGELNMKDVSFSYVPEKPLIESLCLNVLPGQRVAIVGPTGCGKTTLINLLMRFYDVRSGAISVDGKDIRQVTRESLRENYGMVLQETWIKSGTVRENIALARPEATDEEIKEAAKRTHAHSFIKRLKNGYDTKIGEGGTVLSQGQMQLLCITRVMLALPPMLILDEATSSIDTITEIKIQKAFNEMMQGRTSFIVAHRLSTVRGADLILVMKNGNIIEMGNHEELLLKGGFYKSLYESQFAH